jgi:Tfp pilus assembly protein PilX
MKILLATLLTGALALSAADRPAKRQVAQHERIETQAANGNLTQAEEAKLKSRERRVRRQTAKDRVDGGGLTPAERAKAEAKQDALSRQIARESRDAQTK